MKLIHGGKTIIAEPRLIICPKCAKGFKFPHDVEPPICPDPDCRFRFPIKNPKE